jgi:hypothetical protein
LVLVGLLAVGCGRPAPQDYTDQTRAELMAACQAEHDPPLVGDICACVYRSLQVEVAYERFQEIDRELRLEPHAPLPDDVVDLLAECIIEVGNL